ncbi:alanine racemase [Johnsonella ignava]|jgi:alanine racemase|uniref:alanine racemase n=1 Tax=Johnsonella ignava TaxID=43995 RepID=UPI0023F18849|nr:alanine racemase [Johnsonella ignava]
MVNYKRVRALIALDVLENNIKEIKKHIPHETKIAGVIKADGYGHGDIPVAKTLENLVDFYAVSTLNEALNLYYHNLYKPILVLGPLPGDDYRELVENNIRATVFTLKQALSISNEAKKQSRIAYIHIAVDTGMNRIGIKDNENGAKLVKQIHDLDYIQVEGIFTHMYAADESNTDSAYAQLRRFKKFLFLLKKQGIEPRIKHISNSAAIIRNIGDTYDMVRAGIIMYGISPSDETGVGNMDIKPILSVKSMITYVKYIEKGETVSYGGVYKADKRVRVATIPIGYGDGYPRSLSNKGYVLINGKRAYILGRVCMDQMMVDVSCIPDADIGTEVTVIGRDGSEFISVESLAKLCDKFPYELVCDLSKRIPRIYTKGELVVGIKDYTRDMYRDFLY